MNYITAVRGMVFEVSPANAVSMKILVACEMSGRVRDAFRARGHDAISCDILPSELPGPHIQGDVLPLLREPWDLVISFPPCTHLSCIGASQWKAKQADGRQQAAVSFFMSCYEANSTKVCVENPQGWMNTHFRRPDQVIQPWHFGDPFEKKTSLWLRGLPKLVPDVTSRPDGVRRVVGGQRGGVHRTYDDNRGVHRSSKLRSMTYPAVARAMAEQWG